MKKVFFLIVSALIFGLVFTGCSDIANITGPATVNTDGNLYKCECASNSATGMGDRIKPKGTWFMYNYYNGTVHCFDIHAGNPAGFDPYGVNIIGEFCIYPTGVEGEYVASYSFFEMNPPLVAVDEHLAISNSHNFTAAPGLDDNADFGVPFYDADGNFYVFAHFAVECAE